MRTICNCRQDYYGELKKKKKNSSSAFSQMRKILSRKYYIDILSAYNKHHCLDRDAERPFLDPEHPIKYGG